MNPSKQMTNDLKELLRSHRKYNAPFFNSQSGLSKSGNLSINSHAPFSHYLRHVLKKGDKAPRGKFFKNKSVGIPTLFMDELNYNGHKFTS